MKTLAALLVTLALAACAEHPRPSPEGAAVETPDWCKAMIAKGGQC